MVSSLCADSIRDELQLIGIGVTDLADREPPDLVDRYAIHRTATGAATITPLLRHLLYLPMRAVPQHVNRRLYREESRPRPCRLASVRRLRIALSGVSFSVRKLTPIRPEGSAAPRLA